MGEDNSQVWDKLLLLLLNVGIAIRKHRDMTFPRVFLNCAWLEAAALSAGYFFNHGQHDIGSSSMTFVTAKIRDPIIPAVRIPMNTYNEMTKDSVLPQRQVTFLRSGHLLRSRNEYFSRYWIPSNWLKF